ncbi:hypothetical protein PFUGPA_05334 [Plasmodium falciparum Palo Alto/Uganda]|uniref:Uncharacterized protein n=1 Tax=Plasmodium falciparum (isolate Palo Alto / Uganda) TaxID=57270 RepID=W4ISA8_PLAFP|nr:hypothetical protein PFUGPA_05334 [Plasmodium falciparum Palo Alto/Uganda]
MMLLPTNFRSLKELSHETRTNHKHKINELRESKKKKKKNTRTNIEPMIKTKQKSPNCQSRISKFKIDNSFFIVPVYVLIYGIGFLDYLLYLCLKNAFS